MSTQSENPTKLTPAQVTNHLANERTFLAWLRTAIALISFGLLIVRMRYLVPQNGPATPRAETSAMHITQIGLIFSGIGLLMVMVSLVTFFQTRRAINQENYQAQVTGVIVFALAVLGLGIAVMVYLMRYLPPSMPALPL